MKRGAGRIVEPHGAQVAAGPSRHAPQPPKRLAMKLLPLAPLFLALPFALGSCNIEAGNAAGVSHRKLLKDRYGERCTVQLRRDALGAGADLPVPPTTSMINGAEVTVAGELLTYDTDGLMITTPEGQLWIPAASVLLVSFP